MNISFVLDDNTDHAANQHAGDAAPFLCDTKVLILV